MDLLKETRPSADEERGLDQLDTRFADAPEYFSGQWVPHEGFTHPLVHEKPRLFTVELRGKHLFVVAGALRGPLRQVSTEQLERDWFNQIADDAQVYLSKIYPSLSEMKRLWVNRTLELGDSDRVEFWQSGELCEVSFPSHMVRKPFSWARPRAREHQGAVSLAWGNNVTHGLALESYEFLHLVQGLVVAQFIWIDFQICLDTLAKAVWALQKDRLGRRNLDAIEREAVALSLCSIGYWQIVESLHLRAQGLWGDVAKGVLEVWDHESLANRLKEQFEELSRMIEWRRNLIASATTEKVELVAFVLASLSVVDLAMTIYEFALSGDVVRETVGGRAVSLFDLVAAMPSDVILAFAMALVSAILFFYVWSRR